MTRRYTPIVDHLTEGLQKVPEQYRGKPLLGSWVAINLRAVELLHDAAEAVCAAFDVDLATGFRLDWIGKKVGQPRIGTTDEVYRKWIRAKILANRSRGKNPDVRKVASVLLTDLKYWSESNAISIETTDAIGPETAHAIVTLIQSASPGIPVYLYYNVATNVPFGYSSALGLTSTEGGYSAEDEDAEPEAGVFAAVVTASDFIW